MSDTFLADDDGLAAGGKSSVADDGFPIVHKDSFVERSTRM